MKILTHGRQAIFLVVRPGYQNSNHEHEEFCDELNYWECLESANCDVVLDGGVATV